MNGSTHLLRTLVAKTRWSLQRKNKFSSLQARLYKQMVTHNKLVVSDGKGGKTGARGLSNMIMQLRKLCNHPFVFDEVENQMNPLNVSNDLLWRTAGKF